METISGQVFSEGTRLIMTPFDAHSSAREVEITSLVPIDRGGSASILTGTSMAGGTTIDVALKVFRPLFRSTDKEIALRDLRASSRVRHRHIQTFLGFCEYSNHIILVSELQTNGNLLQFLLKQPGTDRRTLLLQLAEAVQYLHDTEKLVHGDIKAENGLVSSRGEVLLIDFGLSAAIDKADSDPMTTTGMRSQRTLRHAALEILIGEGPRSKTTASDIYAFGCTIYQVFTGHQPWPNKIREHDLIIRLQRGEVPSRPTDAVVPIGDDIWQLCLACWHKSSNNRPIIAEVLLRLSGENRVSDPRFYNFAGSPNYIRELANGMLRRWYGQNPALDATTKLLNESDMQYFEKVDNFVSEDPVLGRFFKANPTYIRELAKKAAELEDDKSTVLGCPDLLPKTIKVTLYQQVVYCDDSSSMKRDGRWAAQVDLVKRIAQITTRILPEGEGVALRFINQSVDDSPNLSLQQIGDIMQSTSWAPNGNTEMGTYLRARILEPMVYSKLEDKTLERPLLVSVITDGMPSHEVESTLVDAIKECGDKLQAVGLPRESVKFMIGQVGTANQATKFLNALRDNQEIADVTFVTSDQLDERFAAFKANEADLDRWLIETLFSPIKNRGE